MRRCPAFPTCVNPMCGGTVDDDLAVTAAARPAPHAGSVYAGWIERVVATVLDNAVLAGTAWLTAGPGAPWPSLAPGLGGDAAEGFVVPELVQGWVLSAFAILVALQAWTGYTPGKLVMGIAVVREETSRPAGLVGTVLRLVAHLLDAILLLGYLRPLWHPRRQTFADSLLSTVVVVRAPALSVARRRVVGCAALVVCVLGLCFGCFPWNGAGSVTGETAHCEPATEDGSATTHTLSLTPSSHQLWEQRLWIRRHHPDRLALDVDWSWATPSDAGQGDRYSVEIAVAEPGGRVVQGSPWSAALHELPRDQAGLVETEDFGDGKLTGLQHDARESAAGTVRTATLQLVGILVPDGAEALEVTVRLLADDVDGARHREAASCSITVHVADLQPTS